jgi:hypothetical protein
VFQAHLQPFILCRVKKGQVNSINKDSEKKQQQQQQQEQQQQQQQQRQ